jgi:hypothetical protein
VRGRIAALARADERLARRRLVNFAARLRESLAGAAADVAVLDLSGRGCKLAPAHGLAVEQVFWLKLAGLEARLSQVVWIEGAQAGCEFCDPLEPEELEMLCAPQRQVVRTATPGLFGRAGRRS